MPDPSDMSNEELERKIFGFSETPPKPAASAISSERKGFVHVKVSDEVYELMVTLTARETKHFIMVLTEALEENAAL